MPWGSCPRPTPPKKLQCPPARRPCHCTVHPTSGTVSHWRPPTFGPSQWAGTQHIRSRLLRCCRLPDAQRVSNEGCQPQDRFLHVLCMLPNPLRLPATGWSKRLHALSAHLAGRSRACAGRKEGSTKKAPLQLAVGSGQWAGDNFKGFRASVCLDRAPFLLCHRPIIPSQNSIVIQLKFDGPLSTTSW